ncbi:MAG TPA: hypothetical protein P5205_03535 [Candidatus Paceibacterota bacterium]|nr:hypothetical protein [Verrucomicrobiota bacterium]HSA09422.1 hypothetical protein [Candidatus Paceibacterota bacterium]
MLGWKAHITRFNVLHDGTLINAFSFDKGPQNPLAIRPPIPQPWAQFAFIPAARPEGVPSFAKANREDYGDVIQGWEDRNAPVLWSEWQWGAYLLRQRIFAHVPGGKELRRGDEPLFAWVRLSVHYAAPALPLERPAGFAIRINRLAVNTSMELRHNLKPYDGSPRYERELKPEAQNYSAGRAFRLLEPDGRVRLAVAPGVDCKAVFRAGFPSPDDSILHVQLPPGEGSFVDLLIPMLPTDRALFDEELALGYDGGLKEAEMFWSEQPATAARFDVPEDHINQAIKRNLQFDQITADLDPATGDTHVLTGAMGYGIATWATPVSIALAGFLDPLGYHSLVKRYLKVFKDAQGTVTPPGDAFRPHPGYLGVPKKVAIVNWLPDHGALLWVMAQHGLLTGDTDYIKEYTPVIIKACEWIRDARRIGGHGGVAGVMPPAGASDEESRTQVCWTDGWIYKGLSTAVEFLKQTDHPRAAEFDAEAKDYKDAFIAAFRAKAATMPGWRDDRGQERALVPYSLAKEDGWQYRWITYLDTGPMHLVFAGLMDANDPLMKDAVAWFREGPPTRLYRPYGVLSGHVPSLRHEMSSWEGCYSWNLFHTWQLGDRKRFLEGMYSQFAGAMSQQTYTVCESRGGQHANIFWMPTVLLARLAVLDDEIAPGELRLLRLCPLAWLSAERETVFENLPTKYGPATLRFKKSPDGRQLEVRFAGQWRERPAKVLVHVPPLPELSRVLVNGKRYPARTTITLREF